MKKFQKQKQILMLLVIAQALACFSAAPAKIATADTTLQNQLDYYSQQIQQLNQQIAQYEQELKQVGANKRTLQNAIYALDLQRNTVQTQINVTQNQINSTQVQLQQLAQQISQTNNDIANHKAQLAAYIQQIQQAQDQPAILQMLSSGSFSDFWQNLDQTQQIQTSIQQQTDQLESEQQQLVTDQNATQQKQDQLNAQNKTLADQQQQLNATVQSKNQLLAQTNNQESKYQKLLAAAEAELQSFSRFTQNAGGAKLLANQTVCDSWGCYYNQRDVAWGAEPLDGTQYSMASDGCLVTAMAMVMTHYGYKDVTPETINANSTNFASYYPAFLLQTINADGVSATRVSASIDATLATGNPVVIGMRVYGGTHFVVLVSGSGGRYVMRDPYLANAKDISFNDHYNLGEIYSISRVVIQ